MKTRITELFGISYPIVQGAMHWIANAELAAAVSNAGGLGIISSARFPDGEGLRREVLRAKELTENPFAVNLSLNPVMRATARPRPNEEFVQVLIEEKVPIAETSGARSPEEVIPVLHAGGVKVIHKAATIRHAVKAQDCGADAIALVGFENGGNVGMEDTTTMVLIPRATEVIRVPLLAGGGIADGRSLGAALSLGADGVLMATRFMATVESPVHPAFKEWMLRAQENETVLVQRSIRNTHRALRNRAAEEVLAMEARGATVEELLPFVSGDLYRECVLGGRLEDGLAYCGQVVGLLHDVPTVQQVVDRTVAEARATALRLSELLA